MPRVRRTEVRTNYRFSPEVKAAVEEAAQHDNRSENKQAEYLIQLGLKYRAMQRSMEQVAS